MLAGEGDPGGDEVGGCAIEDNPTAVAASAGALADTVRRVLSFRWLRARKGFPFRDGVEVVDSGRHVMPYELSVPAHRIG